MLQSFRHHFIEGVCGIGGIDLIPLPGDVFINRADSAAKDIYRKFLNRGKSLTAAVSPGSFCFLPARYNRPEYTKMRNPDIEILVVSAKTGEGIPLTAEWVLRRVWEWNP